MNAFTKVLVVLVLVLSVVFAGMEMALYGKREDFGKKYITAQQELDKAKAELEETKGALQDTQDRLTGVSTNSQEKIQTLQDQLQAEQNRVSELVAQLEKAQANVERLTIATQKQEEQIATLRASQDEISKQLADAKQSVTDKEKTIGELRDVVAQKDDAVNSLENQLAMTKKARTEAQQDVARLNNIIAQIRRRGISVPPSPTPAVNAVVVRVDQELGTVVIDKGQQSEVKANTIFTIYDDDGFVGTLVIHDVWDSVAGGIMTRVAEGRRPEVGDLATTEIQVQ